MRATEEPRSATYLDRIVADVRAALPETKRRRPEAEVRARAEAQPPTVPFAPPLGAAELQVIAEVKRASPSKGLLAPRLEHAALAQTYALGGAAAISVLTEPKHFLGSLQHLEEIRARLDGYYPGGRPPLLRKDFIVEPYQVWEARAAGADALLLIVAVLDDAPLADLLALARSLGMEALVEVHDETEVERALRAGALVVGANNRDLRTFQVDLATTERLRPLVPGDRLLVAESGISGEGDCRRMRDAGADAVLVGEALVRSQNVVDTLRALRLQGGGPKGIYGV